MTTKIKSGESKRFLLSARDTGAAGHILAIASGLLERGYEARLVMQGAALRLARRIGAHCEDASTWLDETDPLNPATRAALGRTLAETRPDAVICGISSFHSNGIDEALMLAASDQGIRCFAMQDFWGDVKFVDGVRADDYLVLDETAARITRSATGAACHVVGSPKHANLVTHNYGKAREAFRRAHEIGADDQVVCLFGQSLQALKGYETVLSDLASTLIDQRQHSLIYKPHPLESSSQIASTVSLLTAKGLPPNAVVSDPIEAVLSGCDVALSCFSTIGLDAAYLCRATGRGPVVVYADYPADITGYWRNESGLTILPAAHDGYALLAKDRSTLARCLTDSTSPEVRWKLRQKVEQVLPDPRAAVERAVACLLSAATDHGQSPATAKERQIR
ncbi:hypothetical protein [Hoeflea sp.]|uniref:hypothetical protein n=1 Tax=Hoeflea sp. TaxID=1940281 RepID=UPI003BB19724